VLMQQRLLGMPKTDDKHDSQDSKSGHPPAEAKTEERKLDENAVTDSSSSTFVAIVVDTAPSRGGKSAAQLKAYQAKVMAQQPKPTSEQKQEDPPPVQESSSSFLPHARGGKSASQLLAFQAKVLRQQQDSQPAPSQEQQPPTTKPIMDTTTAAAGGKSASLLLAQQAQLEQHAKMNKIVTEEQQVPTDKDKIMEERIMAARRAAAYDPSVVPTVVRPPNPQTTTTTTTAAVNDVNIIAKPVVAPESAVSVNKQQPPPPTPTPTAAEGNISGPDRVPLVGPKLSSLLSSIDPSFTMDAEVEEQLLYIASDFVDRLSTLACRLARHRGSKRMEVMDVQRVLVQQFGMHVPGVPPLLPPATTQAGVQQQQKQQGVKRSASCTAKKLVAS